MKRKFSARQVLAIAAVVILAGLYAACLVLSLIHNEWATQMLKLTIVLTVLIPVTAYIIMMFYKLAHRNDSL